MAEQIMRDLLLDTHALLWATRESRVHKLSETARTAIEGTEGKVYVSAVSAYEIAIKYRHGKLHGYKVIAENYADTVKGLDAEELPLTAEQARDAGMLDWDHKDPFDRMLAAQAKAGGLSLVTCDKAFGEAPGVEVLW
jgi:PIN domain nuclease of toxin-antitoxin system